MLSFLMPLLRIAWQDSHGSRKSLFLFSSGLFLGISVLVFSLAVRGEITRILDGEALAVLGANATIRSKYEISEDLVKTTGSEKNLREVRFRSMATFADGSSRLTQIRAAEEGYPFYGEVETIPSNLWRGFKNTRQQVLLDDSLFLSSKAEIGQNIKVGNSNFIISGSVKKAPGGSFFSSAIAPRIYMNFQDAYATGLLSRQSIADYYLHMTFAAKDAQERITSLKKDLPDNIILETAQQSRERLGNVNDNILVYFSLVGLASVVLGAIGAASSLYFYLQGKIRDSAILRCLGFKGFQVTLIYFFQLLGVSLITSTLAGMCGIFFFFLATTKLSVFFSQSVQFTFPFDAFFIGAAVGTVTLCLAAVPGIIILLKTPASSLLKDAVKPKLSKLEGMAISLIAFLVCPIFLIFFLQAKQALYYGFVFNFILIVLWFLSHLSKRFALKIGKINLPFIWKYGLLGLGRPGNTTTALINAFTLSICLSSTLLIVQYFITSQVATVRSDRTANLFIYDVQPDQLSDVRNLVTGNSLEIAEEVPIVLMRIKKIKGQDASAILKSEDKRIPDWTLKRDYWTSYRSKIQPNEKILSGNWVGEFNRDTEKGLIPISVDASLAKNLKVGIGDEIEFDIQGVRFETQVASLRRIRWEQMQRNAFIVFPKGVLEDAPKFLFITAYAPDRLNSAHVQRLLSNKFAGISVVDIRSIADTLLPMLESLSLAVMLMAGLLVLTAIMILISAVISGKGNRAKELKLLRVLGATRTQTRRIELVEYFSLGLMSSTLAIMISILLSYTLSIFVIQADFKLPLLQLFALQAGSVALICAISFLSKVSDASVARG